MKKNYERPVCATILTDVTDVLCASNVENVNDLSVGKLFPTLSE